MSKVQLEATSKDPTRKHVTMEEVADLITRAQMMGCPPDATIGFDSMLEFRTPIRAWRVVLMWEA